MPELKGPEIERFYELGELRIGTEDWSDIYPLIFRSTGLPIGKILDVGSADSRLENWFEKNGFQEDVVSFDIRNFGARKSFIRGTARELPFRSRSFDTVVSIGAISMAVVGSSNEALYYDEMIRVAKQRIILWPSNEVLVKWLPCYPNLDVKTFSLYEKSQKPNLKVLTIEKHF